MHAQWSKQLTSGLAELELELPEASQQQLLDYLALLQKWNRAFNLTAIRDPLEMVPRQLLDSLAVVPWITGQQILDVGSGAGLPGIPLALAFPDRHFSLLDSNQKKTRFLNQVVLELGLTNVDIVTTRVEAWRPERRFDHIISRAFSSLEQMLDQSRHLLASEGNWLALKGRHPEQELAAVDECWQSRVIDLQVPYERAERCLVVIQGCAANR